MDQLQVLATFPTIAASDLAEFKQTVEQAMELIRQEPDTLEHNWFFNADETRCLVRESYADSDAVLTHVANMGDLLGKLIGLGGGLQLAVFGTPSEKLVAATAVMQPEVFSHFIGK